MAQPPPPAMPVAEAGPSQVQGGAVPVMPVLHLHRHEHVEGVVDQEARAMVERLATQYGELFSFLHQEIESLKRTWCRKSSQRRLRHGLVGCRGKWRGKGMSWRP